MKPQMPVKRIGLVQQSVWRAKPGGAMSMPLASGYLKAAAQTDAGVRAETDIWIYNFSGGDSTITVINALLDPTLPDLVGFSVLGWNYHLFGRVSDAYKQLRPGGWIVWGGTHAANQAQRIFGMYPSVDIVVNGEGEWVFTEILRAFLAGRSKHDLHAVRGLSFREHNGGIVTTPSSDRVMLLDAIPSPILSGALPLVDRGGRFLYESALLETNRGCPYTCAFCYWGGAIGQKIRPFSLDRLSEEIDCLARLGVERIDLCDANFGMLPADEAFLELCVKARERHGCPTRIVTSWAKNKGPIFHRMVRRMKQTGFHSAFNLALQSLSEPVLQDMGRRNMKVNEWEQLAVWLRTEGLDTYAELIWGCPGETYETFLDGYDRLAAHVSRIAIYPHLLLPNTQYSEKREKFGIVGWRGEDHDFELVLSHDTLTAADNRKMHRFLFWARVFGEHSILRHIWIPLRAISGLKPSQILLSLDRWFQGREEPVARTLQSCRDRVESSLEASSRIVEEGLECCYGRPELDLLMEQWWTEAVLPLLDASTQSFFRELFRYDWLTRALYRPETVPGLRIVNIDGDDFYVRASVHFEFDIPAALERIRSGDHGLPQPKPTELTFYYKAGFCTDRSLYHNAQNEAYWGTARVDATVRIDRASGRGREAVAEYCSELDTREPAERTLARILAINHIKGSDIQFTSGHRNCVARVDRTCVVRFSTEVDAAARFLAEADLLCRVRRLVPVPEVLAAGDLDGIGYQIQTYVEGESLGDCWQVLAPSRKAAIASQLAALTSALHSVTFSDFGPLCPPSTSWASWKDRTLGRLDSVLSELRQCQTDVSSGILSSVMQFMADRSNCLDQGDLPVLVHNDLWPGNVLIKDGNIAAVLDFELAQKAPRDAELFKLDSFCAEPEVYSCRGEFRDLFDLFLRSYPGLIGSTRNLTSRLDAYDLLSTWNAYLFDVRIGCASSRSARAAVERTERITQGRIERLVSAQT
jgi:aminoglycoside phosphotransferase (APT) family kinase protein/tRNA A37 methylthiotransferase MiaB